MKNSVQLIFGLIFFPVVLTAQMWNGQDTLYGNEWIDFEQEYFKVKVAEDGIYRIPIAQLQAQGIPVNTIDAEQFQLFRLGEEVPIYISSSGALSNNDYIEFYGQQNRAELDNYLFRNPEEGVLNPLYSLFNDTTAYFLTWAESGTATKRMGIEGNVLANLPPKEAYYWHDLILNYTDRITKKEDGNDIKQSIFDTAEGYSKGFTASQTITVNPDAIYPLSDSSFLYLRMASNARSHNLLIKLDGQDRASEFFFGHELKEYRFGKVLGANDTELNLEILGQQASNDRYSVANVILSYPRIFDFSNTNYYEFNLKGSSQRKYLEIENFNVDAIPVVYDLQNNIRISASNLVDGDVLKLALSESSEDRKIVLANSTSGIREVVEIQKVEFIDYAELDAEYIYITHPILRNGPNGTDPVQEYADYRASAEGGSHTPIIVNMQQLYDQFAYGINRHSISIRNFGHYVKKNWPNPRYVLLLGKAQEYPSIRTPEQFEGQEGSTFFVPTFGTPGGDNLILSTNQSNAPIIPLGRIAATSPELISVYLNKVKEFERNSALPQTIEDRKWMKRIIHLGGGDVSIQQLIKNHLSAIENVIEGNDFGGEVSSFYKNSSEPIQISQSEQILDLINTGVSIITFFGHSGSNTFDFSLDSPDTYENEGKYPVMFSLGCYSGQIHGSNVGISERFIFEDGKGAIAFFASTSLGYPFTLRALSENYYSLLGSTKYGSGIGEILQQVVQNLNNNGFGIDVLTQQFSLHGDPALVLNAHPGPDYIVDPASVQFDPPKINVELDSFEIQFDVINIGKSTADSIAVEITQVFPNSSEVVVAKRRIKTPTFQNTMRLNLPVFDEESVGLNTFKIQLDADDEVEELPGPDAELNNTLLNPQGGEGVQVFFVSNDVRPVFPKEYGIVSAPDIILKASTANPFIDNNTFVFQLDTSQLFNSIGLKEYKIQQDGGVIRWQPQINWEEDRVYYWRISPDSTDISGFSWRSSSFLYKSEASEGWNQSHFYQLKDNRYTNIRLRDDRDFSYIDDVKDIALVLGTYPTIRPEIAINSNPYRYIPWDGPIRGGFLIAVLDSVSLDPLINDPEGGGDYGSNIPSWVSEYGVFPYSTREVQDREKVMYFLDSVVQKNDYVIIISAQETNTDYEPGEWAADSLNNNGRNLFSVLEDQGATLIRSAAEMEQVMPYYFVYKKDDPSYEPKEGFASADDITTLNFGLNGSWDSGTVASEPIGPARSWEALQWQLDDYDSASDEISIDVIGIRTDSTEQVLAENVMALDTSLSFVQADSFPYLRLRFNSVDTSFKTAPDIAYWRVLYTGLPEMALNPNLRFQLDSDTLQQGDQLKLEIGLENISTYDMDSLLLRYRIVDKTNEELIINKRLQALPKGDSLVAIMEVDTRDFVNDYSLIIEANPDKNQPELFHFNNVGITEFFVKQDQKNPLLDVTFDGIHIMNGDLVSSKPFIVVRLEDDNPFLELGDTSLFKLFLKYPSETELRPIAFDSGVVQFYPAVRGDLEEGNEAKIEIRPDLLVDGTYELVVQAEDFTGNQSGRIDYKIAFQVISKSMISNVFNYPNPFSTSTQFVYTLTGDRAPDYFKIQIMTVSGRVVKEITQAELGPLRPGTNRTEYTWDGTDEFGDQLANGVYLYRVVTRDENGASFERYDTGTDQFFSRNIGKLVILR